MLSEDWLKLNYYYGFCFCSHQQSGHFIDGAPSCCRAKDLIRKLLVLDPAHRLTATTALQHEWLNRPIPHAKELTRTRMNLRTSFVYALFKLQNHLPSALSACALFIACLLLKISTHQPLAIIFKIIWTATCSRWSQCTYGLMFQGTLMPKHKSSQSVSTSIVDWKAK